MLQFLQRIGKALMLPIAVLPAAGIVLRLGSADMLDIPLMVAAGGAIFDNLPLIFAIGVAIGLSIDASGAAGLAGAVGYLVLKNGVDSMNKDYSNAQIQAKYDAIAAIVNDSSTKADGATLSAIANQASLGSMVNMAVFGGIIAGITAGLLYNRFYNIKLPDWLAFFGGRRFVPIITSAVMLVLAFIFGYLWPFIEDGINGAGEWMVSLGAGGAALFGFFNRLLIPVGLHHVLNNIFWFVFGSYEKADGTIVNGDIARFFAGDPTAGIYQAGFFPIMMFALPAAAAAMVMAARKENRKAVAGAMIGLGLTSFLTGITEPIEFSFMFLSPVLYVMHAVLTGLSMAVVNLLGILHGFSFSAGFIDYALNFGIATKPLLLIPVGLAFAVIYYFLFYFMITKFDLKTPGREDESLVTDTGIVTGVSDDKYEQQAAKIFAGLQGTDNVTAIDNCATRLRLQVKDTSVIDEAAIKAAGAKGVMKMGATNVQIIIGTDVEFVADAMKRQK
ncbi:N-acetylglucosamine-specific PTS transporter subunit IIBC [Exiguobacterium oxidotolerans]|uniref:Phosphotransferase system (PTS) N-acetylglucosamine-specific enzyme IICB component n=1 Tax=Exiguobacterium oxidotolerans TaxID=223958 RepID=A0A653I3H6_9BACL|nr:N-acetylglucosamine-specific PTS transporter subunit IIBC [Exiguobacterium oxidotolerans]VWX33517.1 phosphotransferase system (PTS) N-acetylglucosamine-specific enzyme IICB component [Exiguobacterium oxidotolerans]